MRKCSKEEEDDDDGEEKERESMRGGWDGGEGAAEVCVVLPLRGHNVKIFWKDCRS